MCFIYLIVFICVEGLLKRYLHNVHGNELTENDKIDFELLKKYNLCYTFECIKEMYSNKDSDRNVNVDRIIKAFEEKCRDYTRVINPDKAYPFVVIESQSKSLKSKVGHILANMMEGTVINNPPRYLAEISEEFTLKGNFRQAFFQISNYASGCLARDMVEMTPIIINGHFLNQAVYRTLKALRRVPSPSSALYVYPKDLFKPDLILFIDVFIETVTDRQVDLELIPLIYKNWKDPKVVEVNYSNNHVDIIREALTVINKELGKSYVFKADVMKMHDKKTFMSRDWGKKY